jgi:uncharacterized protein YicC (UPF0701 family)
MITSMTGFGSARGEGANLNVLVEIKSVNHRYIDIHVKIPGEYQVFEKPSNAAGSTLSCASTTGAVRSGWM